MDTPQILQFVDKAVYAKTRKRLNDLQRGIIEGTLKRQKYDDIAENCGCSAGHAKDVGYELLQMLSDIFDEEVDKKNLKSVIERQGDLNIYLGARSFNSNHIIGCVNMGSEQATPTPDISQPKTPDLQEENKNPTKIETIDKLRQFGLSDEQIAEALDIPLEQVKQVDLEE
ncbi:MAG: hypothetical protein U7126_02120 [Microcoleus sp.]